MSPHQKAIASSTSSLIWGLKEFTTMVESPTRPWSSLSCFEATPSIQVTVCWQLTCNEHVYFDGDSWQQFVDSWQEVGMCISFVFLSGRIVPCRAHQNFNILFIFNLPFLFLHIGNVFLRGNVFCLPPILPNPSCPLYSPQLVRITTKVPYLIHSQINKSFTSQQSNIMIDVTAGSI